MDMLLPADITHTVGLVRFFNMQTLAITFAWHNQQVTCKTQCDRF